MTKVICFSGKNNTGKSTIIMHVLNEALKMKLVTKKEKKDFSLILEFNGEKIGICSYGDKEDDLKIYLKPLKEANCDIIICACHDKGSVTHKEIIEYFGEGVNWIRCEGDNNSSLEFQKRDNKKRMREFNKYFISKF